MYAIRSYYVLKSGTLTTVYNYAGYFLAGDTMVPFALLLNQQDNTRVITSYSIHYTKLYDIAKITYAEWSAPGDAACGQPAHITVSDLGYGTTINLKLSHIEISSAEVNYDLKPPKGYSQQYLP